MPLRLKKDEIIKKPFKVDIDKASHNVKQVGLYINFNTANPALSELGGDEGLNEISSVLVKHLSGNADKHREGAAPAVFSLLITHGESIENILNGKVNPAIMKTVRDEVKEVGDADIAANKEGLSPEEKAATQEHLKSVQEKLYKDYLNGFISMVDHYKSNVKEEFDKDPENPHSRLYTNNLIFSALINHGCTNYMQDPAFVERMKNTYEKADKTIVGERLTDIDKLYDEIGEKLTEGLIYKDSINGLGSLRKPSEEAVDNYSLFNVFLKNRSMANCSFDTFLERMNYYSSLVPPADSFSYEFNDDMAWTFHIKNMLKEGTEFADFKPPADNGDLYDTVSTKKLFKSHKDYVRKQFYNDVISEFRNTVAQDYNDNTFTQEELDRGIEDPEVKAKVEAPSVAVHSQRLIQRSYVEFLRQLKNTSEIGPNGEPAGNSPVFMDLYNKIKDVAEAEPNSAGESFMQKYKASQEAINDYIEKRDGFLKVHSYGRERLSIAKQMQTMNNAITEKLEKVNEFIGESKKESKKYLFHNEKVNVSEFSEGGKGKEKENLTKKLEKNNTKSKDRGLGD